MQKAIHPSYHNNAVTICSCGAKHKIPGTIKEQHTEICSKCHPFYTGKEKLIDTAGRVDRFKKIKELKEKTAKTRKGKAVKKARSAERKIEKEKAKIKKEIADNSKPKTKK